MKKHTVFEINGKCVDISSDGKGIIKKDGEVYFVPGLFLGEEAEIKVIYRRAGVNYGKITKINQISEHRIQPKCKVCSACGGCQFQQLDYISQLEYKTKKVKESLKRIGGIDAPVNMCIGMNDPYYYRNKIQVPFGLDKRGKMVYGFYKENTHEIISIDECSIEDKRATHILSAIKTLMEEFNYEPYNEDTRKGLLRHVLIRTSKHLNEVMVVLVMSQYSFPGRNNFIKELIKECPEITTIIQNTNSRKTNVILGEKEEILYGKGYISDKLCGLNFKISPKSFYQINPEQCEILYKTAIDFADIKSSDIVLDAYSGIGTIGICAAKKAKKVISIEIVKEAIKDGINNAKNNGINNVNFICADATEYIEKLADENEKIDVVFMDPPRSGSTEIFLNSLMKLAPKKIVYVSCEPSTLARDLKTLTAKYDIKNVQPVDMFPQTSHVENVILLIKR